MTQFSIDGGQMKTILAIVVLLLSLSALNSRSQTPYLQVYFDSQLTQTVAGECPSEPPMSMVGTLWVVAVDFNAYISAIEYIVDYPPEIYFVYDNTGGLDIGNSASGIATAWPFPKNAFFPVVVSEVRFIWNCQACRNTDIPVCMNIHPDTGYLRAARWPDNELIYATTGVACICPTGCYPCVCPNPPVPIEATSWGRIKALYR